MGELSEARLARIEGVYEDMTKSLSKVKERERTGGVGGYTGPS